MSLIKGLTIGRCTYLFYKLSFKRHVAEEYASVQM